MKRPQSRSQADAAWRVFLTGAFVAICFVGCSIETPKLGLYAAIPQAPAAPTSAQISAAFIYNFVKFTEWPPKEFPNTSSPITVCFMAADEVRVAFESISAGKDLNGRPVVIRDRK